ncbi:sulfite exporter TauE/SafE family protein [bacterium]|nr:MAG: sulfite exporter TauE/SafE family protein [bacterium]
MSAEALYITILMFLAAALYSSVGHAGASGYLAIMALFSFAPEQMKPTALALNIFVALIGTYRFYRAGFFSWKLFYPFAIASIPFAFLGGRMDLHVDTYRIVVGIVLLYAAWRLTAAIRNPATVKTPRIWVSLMIGAGLGFVSGLVGVGGGIFLTPLLLLMNWSETKIASGVSAAFILVNSISGIIGNWKNIDHITPTIVPFAAAVVIGGLIGTHLGTRKFDVATLRKVLAIVLVIASIKLILT